MINIITRFPWYLAQHGVDVQINPRYKRPYLGEIAVDVEIDAHGEPYSIAVCGEQDVVSVWFNITQDLIDYLCQYKWILHNAKSDIEFLKSYGIKFSQVAYDTMLGAYVLSSTRQRFGLKALAEEDLGYKWPHYDELVTGKEYIEYACQQNPQLYVEKIKTFKKKPSLITRKLPKRLALEDLPQDLVANYNGMDAWATFQLAKFQRSQMSELARTFLDKIELPTMAVILEMERKGIGINTDKLVHAHKKYRREALQAKRALNMPEVSFTSPVQVLKALRGAGINVASTNEDALTPYKRHPMVQNLLAFRHASKIASTYTKPLYKLSKGAIDGRIRCDFRQSTDTGRLACRNPNLQNQPPEVRDAFEAAPGHVFVNADWSQIELRIPAHFSQDPLLVDAFNNPLKKIHQVTADAIGRSYHIGKTVNFLVTNSGGPERLSQVAEISLEEATAVMRAFWEKFATLRAWTENEKKLAVKAGGVSTLFGRFIPIPDLKSLHPGVKEGAKRRAISGRVQGSAADMMKAAMIKLYKKYSLVPVISLHDELMYECKEDVANNVARVVKDVMENIVTLKVPLIADVGIGRTWAEAKKKE